MWTAHIDSCVFWDKLNWSNDIRNVIKPHMHRGVAEILVNKSGSRNNRMFVFRCRLCNESAAVQYAPWMKQAYVHTRILQVFDFLKLERPTGERIV